MRQLQLRDSVSLSVLVLSLTLTITIVESKITTPIVPLNSMIYGDYQARSYFPTTPNVKGSVKWKISRSKDDIPVQLCIVGNILIAGNQQTVEAFSCQTGDLIWSEAVRKEFDYVFCEEGALIDLHYRLRRYKSNEFISSFITTPEPCYMTLFRKDGPVLLYAYKAVYEPQDRGEEPWKPRYTVMRYENDTRQSYFVLPEQVVANLFAADNKSLIILTEKNVYMLNPYVDMTNQKVVANSYANIINGSISFNNQLLLVEKHNSGYALRNIQLDGKENWSFALSDIPRSNQPPASTPSDAVLFVAGDSMLCINAGKLRWATAISTVPNASYITAFGKSSVLIAAGCRLLQIDDNGKQVFEQNLFFKASCRPIIDRDGAVYAAGKEGICCIQ